MRIAMVHSSFAVRGGAEQYVRDLSRALLGRGHEVRVFCRGSAHVEPLDRPVHERRAARVTGRLGKVATHLGDLVDASGLAVADLADFAPDVVHVHNWQGLGIRPVARIAATYPTCHTVHDYAVADPNNALANRGRSAAGDLLLRGRSAWLVRQLRQVQLLWPAARTRDILRGHVPSASRLTDRVVPLAVYSTRQRPVWRPGDPRTFLFMGALSTHKGIDLLLDAWRSAGPRTGGTLLIAGAGARADTVAEVAARDGSVRFLGFLDEAGKEAALQEAGWLVFPSQWAENFPISCVEALAAGRPIVAAAVARPPMAADSSVRTFEDGDDLARVLIEAASLSPAQYAAAAASAADDGSALDWDVHVDTLLAVYTDLRLARTPEAAR